MYIVDWFSRRTVDIFGIVVNKNKNKNNHPRNTCFTFDERSQTSRPMDRVKPRRASLESICSDQLRDARGLYISTSPTNSLAFRVFRISDIFVSNWSHYTVRRHRWSESRIGSKKSPNGICSKTRRLFSHGNSCCFSCYWYYRWKLIE